LTPHQVAVGDAAPFHVARLHFDGRFRGMGVQARHDAGAAHAVPLVAQAAGVEMQRMARVGGFGQRRCCVGLKRARPLAVGNTPSA
jgi:hypothetical protein